MMYPFLTIDQNTEITHSEMKENGEVKVYIEKPDEQDCFHYATCWLPSDRWENIFGFTGKEKERLKDVIKSEAHLIIQLSQTGGFDDASGF